MAPDHRSTGTPRRGRAEFLAGAGIPRIKSGTGVTIEAVVGPGTEAIDVPDGYDLGLIPKGDINASNFIAISHQIFDMVAFVPRPEDAASSRRVVDYDGETIVVR